MEYLTAMASIPAYEFPYTCYQTPPVPQLNDSINVLLSNITPPIGDAVYNPPPIITMQCVPQINSITSNNTSIYQVPEDTPIEAILQQFGIDTSTLYASNSLRNYYRTASQPLELVLPPSSHPRRRLVCREVSDSEDDDYYRRSSRRHHQNQSNSWRNESQQSPAAIHNLLSRVWNKTRRASERLPQSFSAPNLNSQWQSMRNNSLTPPPNMSVNNTWQAMRNATPPMSQDHQNAVSKVWHRADFASEQNANNFNRMRQTPPPMNQEAVNNFMAVRNLPPDINRPNPAIQNVWNRADYAARNSPPPFSPMNQEAVNNFMAIRNLPPDFNRPNPALQNVWNRADYAARNAPPPPPPLNSIWNRMQQGPPSPRYPPFLYQPTGPPIPRPNTVPAPGSFAAVLAQAHRQHLPYAGAA